MTTKVRASKFRHLFGTPSQLRDCYQDVRLGQVSPESTVLKANASFMALPWITPGSVIVFPHSRVGAVPEDSPLLIHEEGTAVNELNFSPFNDNVLATAANDGCVRIWNIPTEFTQSTDQPAAKLEVSSKRLLDVSFHNLAENVLLTTLADGNLIKLYDVASLQERITLQSHKGAVTTTSWSYDGSLLATTCKDKLLRLFDPRKDGANPVASTADHQGAKSARSYWLGRLNKIMTVGFTKTTGREIAIYDPRNMSGRIGSLKIDENSSSLLGHFDPDLNIFYQTGKGDGTIRFYEVVDEAPYVHYLNEFRSKEPAAGIAALPKTSLNIMKIEVARFLKLIPAGQIIPIRFEVPRTNSDFFQDDLFPDTWDGKPTTDAAGWFGGANGTPGYRSLKP